MGNCLSANDDASLRDLVLRPGTADDLLTAEQIESALQHVASVLHAQGSAISIVAVGGAVNTLYLKSRHTTHDVDFFYRTKTKNEDVTQVIIAADKARKALNLAPNWLNNHTALFIQEGSIQQLYDEAVAQGEVIFAAAGLTVYAAPWRYALGAKLLRVSSPDARRGYDIDDAVAYLDKLVAQRGGRAVTRAELKGWAAEFKFAVAPDDAMDRLERAYRETKGRDGLIGE